MIHKNKKANHKINVKVKFQTYFQLKFIFIMHPLGYITRPWSYIRFITLLKSFRHKYAYKKIQLLLKTMKNYTITKKFTIFDD